MQNNKQISFRDSLSSLFFLFILINSPAYAEAWEAPIPTPWVYRSSLNVPEAPSQTSTDDAQVTGYMKNYFIREMAKRNCSLTIGESDWNTNFSENVWAVPQGTSMSARETKMLMLETSPDYSCSMELYTLQGGIRPMTTRTRTLLCSDGSGPVRTFAGTVYSWACKPRVIIAIDPGHGLTCPEKGMAIGAVGVTDFPPNDPPPGKLREDNLTVAIALELERILPASKYKVVMTKRDVNSCPSFRKRGEIANRAKAKVFVSIHINKQNTVFDIEVPFGNGTSVLYHPSRSDSKVLADQMAGSVSSSLGVNNRGSFARDDLTVLDPEVTKMTAVLVEAARLSGSDEKILHAPGSATKAAAGISAAIDTFLGK